MNTQQVDSNNELNEKSLYSVHDSVLPSGLNKTTVSATHGSHGLPEERDSTAARCSNRFKSNASTNRSRSPVGKVSQIYGTKRVFRTFDPMI